jgi:hypothetical protein
MFERNVSGDSHSTLYLVLAIPWGVICVGSIWIDFGVRHVPLSMWRWFWDFLLASGLCLGNARVYQNRRSKEREAA